MSINKKNTDRPQRHQRTDKKNQNLLIGLIHLNRLAVEVYQADEPRAEIPRARGCIPGTGMVLDPLDISPMFDWV